MLCCGAGGVVLAIKKAVERANDTPSDVEVGAEFKHDGFVAEAGWDVVEARGDFGIADLTLENSGLGTRPAFLELTLYRDDHLAATISCSANPIAHSESGPAYCFSADEYGDYDTIRVADTF